jgi:glucan phosphoethanolaminetransferase (alkaline phosphatase superfamily)
VDRAPRQAAPWRVLALAVYFVVLASPNLVVVWIYPGHAEILKFILSCAIIAVWHAAFARPRVAMLCSIPFFLMLPFVLFAIATYREPPTLNVIASMFDTSLQESSDYLTARLGTISGYCFFAAAAWAIGFWGAAGGWPGNRIRAP